MINFSKYINLPYKNLGRSFDGVDCYGLIWLIYKGELGIELPDFTELCYSQRWYKEKKDSIITENIDRRWVSVVLAPPSALSAEGCSPPRRCNRRLWSAG